MCAITLVNVSVGILVCNCLDEIGRDGWFCLGALAFDIGECSKISANKLGCVVRMVIDSILHRAKSGPNDHRKDAPPFTRILLATSFQFHFRLTT